MRKREMDFFQEGTGDCAFFPIGQAKGFKRLERRGGKNLEKAQKMCSGAIASAGANEGEPK